MWKVTRTKKVQNSLLIGFKAKLLIISLSHKDMYDFSIGK